MACWLVFAFRSKKSVRMKSWWQRQIMVRLVLFIIVVILIRLGAFGNDMAFFQTPSVATLTGKILGVIGLILCAAGVSLAIWARVYLGRNWGMPMTLRQEHELVTSGPYRFVRHPIYSGFFLAAFGSIFTSGAVWLVILLLVGIYFAYSATVEEKNMAAQFPDTYPEYRKRTKMFIPFVW